jgi:hypothetical protein
LRSFLLSTLAYILAVSWKTPDILLLLKLPVISLLICMGYFVLGEFSVAEKTLIRSLFSAPAKAETGD